MLKALSIKFWLALLLLLSLNILSACTFHPVGESTERLLAEQEGSSFKDRFDDRTIAPLSTKPTLEEILNYALLTNPELEARYFEWRAAIEEIPQAGTEPSNVAIFGGTLLNQGKFSLDRTTATLGNDPMANIVLPVKLSHAAKRALKVAQASGKRFQQAKYDLRAKVINSYYDYALNEELILLAENDLSLLQKASLVSEVRSRVGTAGQVGLLKVKNEVSLSENDISSMKAKSTAFRANLNALLSRDANEELLVSSEPSPSRSLSSSDEELLWLAAEQNPELLALAHEVKGKKEGLTLAKLQYLPDFSLSVGADLGGIAQNIMAMVTLPLFGYEAIQGGIEQARAMLRANEAMERKAQNDLKARVILDIITIRDLDRQLTLFKNEVIPRTEQVVNLSKASYKVGHSTLLEFLENQRSLVALRRLTAELHASREKTLADLEAAIAMPLT